MTAIRTQMMTDESISNEDVQRVVQYGDAITVAVATAMRNPEQPGIMENIAEAIRDWEYFTSGFYDYRGLNKDVAKALAASRGYHIHITKEDGLNYMSLCNVDPSRINVEVELDIIVKVTGIG